MVKDILRSIEVQLLFFSFFSVGNEGRYDNSNLFRSIGKGVLPPDHFSPYFEYRMVMRILRDT